MTEVEREIGGLMLLGVDIGTTCTKACMYDEAGRLLGSFQRPTPTRQLPNGGAEYEASAIEHVAFEAMRQVSERFGPPQAIGISGIAESGFLVDRAGGPLIPAIAWFDGRTAPQAARWGDRMDPFELFCRTGLHFGPIHTACKLEWHKENSPEAWKEATGWLGVAEYLAFRMTGQRGTDPSLASRTLLFRIDRGEWDEELCELAAVPPELLPPVREAGTGVGGLLASVGRNISAPEGIPVAVCGHDHVCGVFGAGAMRPGEVVDSMGTAEACLLTLHSPPLNNAVYDLDLLVGQHVVPGGFYVAASLPESGGAVEWMLRLLQGDEEDLPRWTEWAETLSPGEGGVVLPRLHGEDYGMAFCALSKEGDPAHVLRALLEGLTLEIDATLKQAARATGTGLENLTVIGGGARNALWRQLKADASGLPVRVVSDPQCVARGAAMLAGVGSGIFKNHDSVPAPGYEPHVHSPSGERPVYERLHSEVYEPLRRQLGATHYAWQKARRTR